jgi:hypothetical protein
MKKHSQNSTDGVRSSSLSSLSNLDDHPIIEWISQHGRTLIYSLLGGFVLLLGFYLLMSNNASKDEANYQLADIQFQTFEKSNDPTGAKQAEALSSLTKILQEQPDLHAKYDGSIAQTLINRDQIGLAIPFAQETLKRVSQDLLPFYQEYAQITLLVAENQNAEALKRSMALKEQMILNLQQSSAEVKDQSLGGFLFAFNLLRTAFLQQKVGDKVLEQKSWEEWKRYTSTNQSVSTIPTMDRKALFTVSRLFTEGSLSLDQYIETRLSALATSGQ